MKEFNSQNLSTLRKDLSKALIEVAKQHNIKLEIGTISYKTHSCNMKINCRISSLDNNKSIKELEYEEDFNNLKSFYGLKERKIGDVCVIKGERLTLLGIAVSRKKYPISFKRPNGRNVLVALDLLETGKWE